MAGDQNIIGEVGLRVVPVDPNAQFTAGVNRIIAQLEKNAQFQVKAAGLEDIQQQANGVGNAFAQASIQAAGLTAAVFGIERAVQGTINKFSGLFDQLAQAKAGFSSILKSEALGNNLLDQIREFARVSPFVTQELVNYSQQLLGVGETANQIIPLLKSTGDILSSVGGDTTQLGRVLFTLTQIKSIGSLKGQDTLQLQNSLIPITKYLSEYLNKTSAEIVKLRENGQITADQVFASINAQGEKVKGAMDKATRNIVGARAILSDTITILLQNQPVLNKIFENIYKGILTLSNFLSTDEFKDSFAQFFDGVDKVYESLKPLFASLGDLGQSATIQGLQVFGTVLGTIGNALSALPTGVLEILGRVLAAMAVLKAPLLLIRYATSIQTIVRGIAPAVSGLAKLGTSTEQSAVAAREATAAYNAEAAALQRVAAAAEGAAVAEVATATASRASRFGGFVGRNAGRIGQGALIGAAVLGGQLSQSKNETAQLAGGALTYGAIGGAVGGPLGAAIGVEFGLLTGYFNKRKEEARKWAKELTDIGQQGAADFVTAVGKQFGDAASGDSFKAYQDRINSLQKGIATEQNRISTAQQSNAAERIKKQGRGVGGPDIGVQKDAITLLQTQLDALQKEATGAFEPIQIGLKSLVENLQVGEEAYNNLTKVSRGGIRTTTDDLVKAQAAADKYGFALADLADPSKIDGIVSLIQAFDGLTTAQQNATKEAEKYNTALDEAKKAASAIFDPEQKKLQSQIDSIKAITEAEAAQHSIKDESSKLAADLAAKKGEEAKYAERLNYYLDLGYAKSTAIYRANIEGEEEYQRLLNLRGQPGGVERRGVGHDAAPQNFVSRDFDYYLQTQIQDREKREKAAKEAQDAADKAAKEALQYAQTIKDATASLADRLTSAAEDIAAAAERWTGSIKERTQYEQAVSVGAATRNAQRQVNDITELTSGLTQLRARGLSDAAIKSLGIDNVSDLKQVRKLLRGSPGDLSKLSTTVSNLNQKSTDLATREEDKRTRDNITAGILDAAKTLGIDMTKDQAAAAGANFTITTISDPDAIAAAIIAQLSSGKAGR